MAANSTHPDYDAAAPQWSRAVMCWLKVAADEDGVGGDDTADALRYLVATRSRAVRQRKLRGL